MDSTFYQVNSPFVVHETIEGEAIIVNLDTGCYYSLDGAGAVMWAHLAEGATVASAAAALQQRYAAPPEELSAASEQLVSALLAENLLRPAPAQPNAIGLTSHPPAEPKSPFVAPRLNKHSDMQDLLLLDPIHEVDEAGWPSAKP